MALNLSRNTRVFVTTEAVGSEAAANTWEILVQDGYSFSQDANADTVTLDEAGDAPTRGQKIFNSSLNPVEVSFTTYIRPFIDTSDSNNHKCAEQILWEALVGAGSGTAAAPLRNVQPTTTKWRADLEASDVHELLKLSMYFHLENTTYVITDVQIASAEIDFAIDGIAQITWTAQGLTQAENSIVHADIQTWAAGTDYEGVPTTADYIKNKLSTMSLKDNRAANNTTATAGYWVVQYSSAGNGLLLSDVDTYDGTNTYSADITVDGGSPQTVSIDSTVAGAGGNTVEQVISAINLQLEGAFVTLNGDGDIVVTSETKGSTSSINISDDGTYPIFGDLTAEFDSIGSATAGTGTGGETYNIAITGGSLTIENNLSFLTPEELAVVNIPCASFTGARSVSGSVTAYLRTGTANTAELLSNLISDTEVITQDFFVDIVAGGIGNTPRALFRLPHAHLEIPSVSVEDVISTEINFTGLGSAIDNKDELYVEYIAASNG